MPKAYTQLYVHLVWRTWDRLPLIVPEVEERIHSAVRAKVEELGGITIAVGGIEDHLHLLCSFPPTVAISYLVQQVKGSTSHLMTHEIRGPDSFKWQAGYGAFTLSGSALERVREYVLNQKVHHAERRLWHELERTWTDESQKPA